MAPRIENLSQQLAVGRDLEDHVVRHVGLEPRRARLEAFVEGAAPRYPEVTVGVLGDRMVRAVGQPPDHAAATVELHQAQIVVVEDDRAVGMQERPVQVRVPVVGRDLIGRNEAPVGELLRVGGGPAVQLGAIHGAERERDLVAEEAGHQGHAIVGFGLVVGDDAEPVGAGPIQMLGRLPAQIDLPAGPQVSHRRQRIGERGKGEHLVVPHAHAGHEHQGQHASSEQQLLQPGQHA